jgi:LysR family transcriptional regulator, flagellar master operon regulator
MDIALARTFLEVAGSGSFVAAAERLNLTQTAVSARIRSLEEELGRRLFVRNKAGARLTPAGERFHRDAIILIHAWERARQRIALPAGRENVASIGGELSLWSPLLANWLIWMHDNHPTLALNAEVGQMTRLIERVREGSLDLAVLYDPPGQPGLTVELMANEKLVMVTTAEGRAPGVDDYVHVDWGPLFNDSFRSAFPDLSNSAVSISLGPLALAYILAVGGAGYFRSHVVKPFIAQSRLHYVPHAPEMSYSVHAVYSTNSDPELLAKMRAGLRACAQ